MSAPGLGEAQPLNPDDLYNENNEILFSIGDLDTAASHSQHSHHPKSNKRCKKSSNSVRHQKPRGKELIAPPLQSVTNRSRNDLAKIHRSKKTKEMTRTSTQDKTIKVLQQRERDLEAQLKAAKQKLAKATSPTGRAVAPAPMQEPPVDESALLNDLALGYGNSNYKKLSGWKEDMDNRVRKHVKRISFNHTKFVQSPQQLMTLTEKVYTEMDIGNLGGGREQTPAEKATWVAIYRFSVCKGLNEKRNYIQDRYKNLMAELHSKQQPLPSPADIKKCVFCQIDMNNDDQVKLFKLYWTKMVLPLVYQWGDNLQFYSTISEAKLHRYGWKLVPAHTEAFALLMVENCHKKWNAMKTHWDANEKVPRKKRGEQAQAVHRTEFTMPEGGQQPFGGWTAKGIKRWVEISKELGKYQKQNAKAMLTVERAMLKILQVEHNITEASAAAQKKANHKRNRGDAQGEIVDIDLSDLEEADWDDVAREMDDDNDYARAEV